MGQSGKLFLSFLLKNYVQTNTGREKNLPSSIVVRLSSLTLKMGPLRRVFVRTTSPPSFRSISFYHCVEFCSFQYDVKPHRVFKET